MSSLRLAVSSLRSGGAAFARGALPAAAVGAAIRHSSTMPGLMQEHALSLVHFFDRCEAMFPHKTVTTAYGMDKRTKVSYGEWADRTRRLGGLLDRIGVSKGARVGSFCWNTSQHLELWYGVPCSGRVLHTLNLRLFPEQLEYTINHAEDEVIFVDRSVLPLLWPLADKLKTVKKFIVINDGAPNEIPNAPNVFDYEELLAAEGTPVKFKIEDERSAASTCYTSGTTGMPKGVVYTHRSLYLHTLMVTMADTTAICESDRILSVVPLFHANAWGMPHAAVATGAELVMPGPGFTPPLLAKLIEEERVTFAAGVPTIWMGMLPELSKHDFSSLRSIACGGSAVPKTLSEAYRKAIGLPITQAYGMTETSPIVSCFTKRTENEGLSIEAMSDVGTSIGVPVLGVDVRICDGDKVLPWDGESQGELQIRGPTICSAYYNRPDAADSFTADGFLRTGDVATIDKTGWLRLKDRTKDVIKSGGEWISSVELENEIMAHDKVKEAAVIALPSTKWGERPCACVVLEPGATLEHEELLAFLAPRVAKWWLPEAMEIVEEIPKTSVGKFSKKDLRAQFEGKTLP